MDADDVEQLGLIALLEASRRYKPSSGVPFAKFLALVVALRLRDAGAKRRAKKNQIVDQALRIVRRSVATGEVEDATNAFTRFVAPSAGDVAVLRDDLRLLAWCMADGLTVLERAAIQGALNERSQAEIGRERGCDAKAVENAAARARRKLAKAIAA